MTVAFGAIGTGANGSTTVAPSYPTGITAGQLLKLVVTSGATNSETPSTPSGWFFVATGASTDGTFGVDAGPRRATVFGRVADGTESGTVTVSITNGNTCRGTISRFTSSTGSGWLVRGAGANDSTSGTGVSMTFAAFDWLVGDVVLVATGQRVDSATQSAQSLTATGVTFGTRTNRAATAVTTGNDHRHTVDTFDPTTAGTGSQAATWAYTASAAASAGGVLVQIRELGNVAESIGFTEAQSHTYTEVPTRFVNEALVSSGVTQALLVRRIGSDGVAPGTFNKQRDEAVAFSDAPSVVGTFAETLAESIGFTDAQVESSSRNSSAAESIGLAATQTESATVNRACAESLSLTAAQDGSKNSVYTKQRDETFSLTDVAAEQSTLNSQRDESLGLTDAQSESSTRNSAQAESFALSAAQIHTLSAGAERFVNEALVGSAVQAPLLVRRIGGEAPSANSYSTQRDESLAFADAATEQATLGSARAEAISLTDASSETRGAAAGQAENLGLSSDQVETATLNSACAESVAFSAAQDGSTNSIYSKQRDEAIGLSEAATEIAGLNSARAESLGLSDGQAEQATLNSARAESIAFADAQTGVPTGVRSVNEALVGSPVGSALLVRRLGGEPAGGPQTYNVSRAESLGLVDAASETRLAAASRAESIGLTAAQSHTLVSPSRFVNTLLVGEWRETVFKAYALDAGVFSRQRDEAVSLTAAQTEATTLNSARAESIAFAATQTGSLLAGNTFNKQRDEALGLTDAQAEAAVFAETRDESIGFTDAQSESASRGAQQAETLGLAATQLENATLNSQRGESIGLADSVLGSKNPVFSKQVAETLGFSDAAIEQAAALHSQINEALGLAAAQAEVAAFTRFMAEAIGFSATQIGGTGRATFDWPRLELLASLGGVTADTRLDPDLELLAAVQPNPEDLH